MQPALRILENGKRFDGFIEKPYAIHLLVGMVVTAEPLLVGKVVLNGVQPFFGGLVHIGLINTGKKDLDGLIFQRAGVGQHRVYLIFTDA